jgi:hypothetical protein
MCAEKKMCRTHRDHPRPDASAVTCPPDAGGALRLCAVVCFCGRTHQQRSRYDCPSYLRRDRLCPTDRDRVVKEGLRAVNGFTVLSV